MPTSLLPRLFAKTGCNLPIPFGVFVFMKTSLLSLLFIGAVITVAPLPRVMAEDDSTSDQPASTSGSTNSGENGGQKQGFERLSKVLGQLDLTEAQKAQIKQIITTVTDRKERRQEIVAVLTPEQKAKLRELLKEHREAKESGTATSSTTDDN